MNRFIQKTVLPFATGLMLFTAVSPVLAGPADTNPFSRGASYAGSIADTAGIKGGATFQQTIGAIINVVLGFLGVVFLALMLYAGFLWMTAQGESKNVDKAKEILKQSIIGLVIIVAAYAITSFVLTSLVNVSTSGTV